MKTIVAMRLRPPRRQSGLALVEFAVLLPLMLFLMFGTAELGRAFYQYNALHKSVQAGARYLADHSLGTSGVLVLDPAEVAAARNLVVYGDRAAAGVPLLESLDVQDVSVSVEQGRYIRVAATYAFVPVLSPLPRFGLGEGGGLAIGPFDAAAVVRALQ